LEQLLSIGIFVAFGLAFVLVNLSVGALLRPNLPNTEKQAIYECGEPAIGSSWVQFDLRFYIVALFYLVFDVEVALIYPWAVVFREHTREAILLGFPFLGIVVIGYVYEWYAGSLEWVRSNVNTSFGETRASAGMNLSSMARKDPEVLEDAAANAPLQTDGSA
jgi:NADH-quinone oxidoreductase subunit A